MGQVKHFLDMRHVHARLTVILALMVFAFIGWMSIRQSVLNKKQARIDAEINRIERIFENRIQLSTNLLREVRTYISASDQYLPSHQDFSRFARTQKFFEYMPGITAIGFAESEPRVVARLITPVTANAAAEIGFDSSSEPQRRIAISKSLKTDDIQFTPPIDFIFFQKTEPGFVGFLPVYSLRTEKRLIADTPNPVLGYVFISIKARDLFEGIFGAPNLANEKINFNIIVSDNGKERILYKRFDLAGLSGPVRIRKDFNPYLSGWSINAQVLPGAINFFDDNLHNIFAAVAFLLIGSIWWSLQKSVSELKIEETNRLQLVDSEKRVKDYSRTLIKLNISIRSVLSEISFEKILPAVAANLRDGLQSDAVAIYLRDDLSKNESLSNFSLRYLSGELHAYEMYDKIDALQIWEVTNLRDVLYASKSNEVFKHGEMFVRHGAYESFIILPFVDQSDMVIGFAIMLSNNEILDNEFLDSFLSGLVKPIGVAFKNSQLFSEAQEAALSKTAFLANMSHEIRTPLGAIVGFTDLLCDDQSIENRNELKRSIHRNSQRLTRIIDDILDFSRFELSQPVLSFKSVHLMSLILDVKTVVEILAQEKNIALKFVMPPGLPEYFETDDVRIKQILLNLIGNAIKFTNLGQVVVEVNYDTSGEFLTFKISDTGCGISRNVREKLFQPFSQGDNTSTRRFGGTGLGLVLSRKLAQALGGNVRLIFSELNRGSIFEVMIPTKSQERLEFVDRAPTTEVQHSEEMPSALTGREILLVEDSIDNQEIFTLFLQRSGASVDLAKSGDEALIKATLKDYDMILMDIQLPVVDGKQVTRILRRRGWKKPIVALTAHALEDERQAVVQAGCDGQITKPVAGTALVFAVKRYLERCDKQIG